MAALTRTGWSEPVLAALEPTRIDLLVVAHVDQDHMLGALELFEDDARVSVGEVWFNGFHHLNDTRWRASARATASCSPRF